jgi:hypothetical protein
MANPDTITKYKVAADISQKVLKEVSGTISIKLALTARDRAGTRTDSA